MLSRTTSLIVVGLATFVLVGTLIASGVARSGAASDTLVLKLGHSLDQSHPVHLAMEYMAERLKEKSNGTMLLDITPNGLLGSETDCIEYVQRGALALTKTSSAPLESFVPTMAIFSIPYVFRDEAHFWKVLESEIGQSLLSAGHDFGIRGLCYYDAGARSFYTSDRPILEPNDLSGLKIRVQSSKTAMDMVKSLGGAATPMAFGELYSGLQQGIVDGAENNPPSFVSNRHYEVCKHYSLDEHARSPDVLIVSEIWWQRLNQTQRTWLTEAAMESTELERRLWKEKTAEALEEAESHGVTIHYPDKQPFVDRVSEMHQSYGDSEVGRLLKKVQEVR